MWTEDGSEAIHVDDMNEPVDAPGQHGPAELDKQCERARALAHRALSQRERTMAELRALLERRGTSPTATEAVIDELLACGLLDDARYAHCFAEDKRRLERWGSDRIERDLLRRGVEGGLIDAALATRDADDELEAARALLADRVPRPPAGDRERDRAWRMLVRRGYQPELAYLAVRAHERDH